MRTITLRPDDRPVPARAPRREGLWARLTGAFRKQEQTHSVPPASPARPTSLQAAPTRPTPLPLASGNPLPEAPPRRPAWLTALGYGAAVLTLAALLAMAFSPALRARLLTAALGGALTLQDITIEGQSITPLEDLLAAIATERGADLLSLDLVAMRERIEAVSWVKTAAIERHLPDRLHVVIEERAPAARWQQKDGSMILLDAAGVRLGAAEASHRALPRFVGAGADKAAGHGLALLAAFPPLAERTTALVRAGERRWDIILYDGTALMLPEDAQAEEALARFMDYDARHGVLDKNLSAIDLRHPDRLIVRLATDAKPTAAKKP